MNRINLFERSTPVNEKRLGRNEFFGNTTADLVGSHSLLQPLSLHRSESLTGLKNSTSYKLHSEDMKLPLPTTMKSSTSYSFLFDTKSSSSKAMTFTFGDDQPSSPNSTAFLSTKTNTSFTFSLSKPPLTSSTPTGPTLFSAMNQTKVSPLNVRLFQTMINNQPFNHEFASLGRNMQPNGNLRPKTNLYSAVLPKPIPYDFSSSKRKFDDEDDALFSSTKLLRMNIKRPRMLDMSKVRSIVLGTNEVPLVPSENRSSSVIRLPRLTHRDYYTEPAIEELRKFFNGQGQCLLPRFTVARKHYGSVTFHGLHMNLAGLNLDRLVRIDRREVTVYPDEKDRPNEGEELNCQAVISLIGVYPIDRSISNGGEEVTDPERLIAMNYGKYLEEMTGKFQGQFLDYDVHTGTWTFQVEHF